MRKWSLLLSWFPLLVTAERGGGRVYVNKKNSGAFYCWSALQKTGDYVFSAYVVMCGPDT